MIRVSGMIPDSMQLRYRATENPVATYVTVDAEDGLNLDADALLIQRHLQMGNFDFFEKIEPATDGRQPVAEVVSWRGIEFPTPVYIVVQDPLAGEE